MNLPNIIKLFKIWICISAVQVCLLNNQVIGQLYEGQPCPFQNGERGVCTKLTQCNVVFRRLQTNSMRFSDLVRCSFSNQEEVICCPQTTPNSGTTTSSQRPPTIEVRPTTMVTTQRSTVGTRTNTNGTSALRTAQEACERYSINASAPISFHILQGIPTQLGEFPHMVALGYPGINENELFWNCGGSLISERYVLTAGHCVNRPDDLPEIVRLGKITLDSSADEVAPLDIGIESIVLHSSYRSSSNYHDIALIRLNRTVNYSILDNIRPGCLYTNQNDPSPDVVLVATGWGVRNITTGEKSNILLKVNLTTVDSEQCNRSYIQSGLTRRLRQSLIESQMCANDPINNGDACTGDSGGPLQIVSKTSVSTIIGITSFGKACGSNIPGVYTKVASYLNWIVSVVWP